MVFLWILISVCVYIYVCVDKLLGSCRDADHGIVTTAAV